MTSKIDYKANRQLLYKLADGCDYIVLTANRLQQRSNDTAFKFRQDSNFLYFTGLVQPDLILIADLKKRQEWLILPALTREQTIFDGGMDKVKLEHTSNLETLDWITGWKRFKSSFDAPHSSKIGVVRPTSLKNINANDASRRLARRLKNLGAKELVDISSMIHRQRAIKSPAEIKFIQQAINITAEALNNVRGSLSKYEYEYEIEADITGLFRRRNAVHAYEPIIAGGRNALTLHYIDNSSQLSSNGLILMDVGAEVGGYAADITRTFPISGKFNTREQEVVSAVQEIQSYAINLIKPGFSLLDYVKLTDDFAKQAVINLGLSHQQPRAYLPHAISHGLGLDVHDRLAHEKFKPGMVLTVEPGIYIDEESIGVRIEDDVLVTETGTKVLSRQLLH